MAQIIPKITIRSVYFGMLLLSAVVMILTVRLSVASELDSIKAKAEQGNADAQVILGFMYANGEGVPQNDIEAARWYRMAAEQGNADAQVILGFMYANGEGVPQNDIEAARWFRMAAEQGYAKAQVNLGFMHFNGSGVPQDVVEAARLFRLAAEQGNADAQLRLGLMYALGKGVPKDDVQAYAWVNIGAAQIGDEESGEFLEAIAEGMTASAITKAQNLSREYWEAYGPNQASSE